MSQPIITVEGLSKSFIISHEGRERYSSLGDTLTQQAMKAFSIFRKPDLNKIMARVEEFWALSDLNFEIQQGDRVGIIGRNGAGKSTLLKILSRITEPTKGRVEIRGKVASLLEVGTGFHPELTGRENIFLNGAILGMSRAEIRQKFDEIVSFAEVEQFLDTPVKRYSSGMYVRLAFAVAAHLEPEVLIVDEVLAVGDSQFQKKCLGKMQDVSNNEGRTVLFVSHNMGVIAQLCNKGILLNNGSIDIQGKVNSVVDRYINTSSANENIYEYKNDPVAKKNYFSKIFTSNEKDNLSSDFAFNESVKLNFEFTINESIPNLQIGIGLQDKLQHRISTFLQPVSYFTKLQSNDYKGSVVLPSSLIAPNNYSFVFVIWAKDIVVNDNVENVCSIKIHDDGTDLAIYEGYDYGSIVLKPVWNNV